MSPQRKTNATKLLALSALFLAAPSYSEYEFGHTNNAAVGGSTWGMSSPLFPMASIPGVDINGVFYRYTAVKDPHDPYTVSVQNEAANGSGYIFRETDDWSGGSGGTIQKYVPVPYSPLGDWGTGSIEQVGIGSVEDPVVMYTYRVDPDRLQSTQEAYDFSAISAYDALSDGYVNAALEPTDPELYEDDEELNKSDSEEENDGRLEKALAAQENALTLAGNVTQSNILRAMNVATNLDSYYAAQIKGGVYPETVVLKDKNIPDNRRALRSLGQQKLHTDMVDQQYGR
jgi:hypothetical protein